MKCLDGRWSVNSKPSCKGKFYMVSEGVKGVFLFITKTTEAVTFKFFIRWSLDYALCWNFKFQTIVCVYILFSWFLGFCWENKVTAMNANSHFSFMAEEIPSESQRTRWHKSNALKNLKCGKSSIRLEVWIFPNFVTTLEHLQNSEVFPGCSFKLPGG